ncbi:MAG: chromosomal replication initiator DnaA [Pseudomonadota bacterium]
MPDQLIFDLPVATAFGRADYFVSEANALAVAQIGDIENWVNGRLILSGPSGAGKTHLLSIWASDRNAECLGPDDIADWQPKAFARPVAIDGLRPGMAQDALVLMLNQLKASGQPVLMTADARVSDVGLTLPDLTSRLTASSHAALSAVDDVLLQAVFLKQASDRQLAMGPDIIDYALARSERSLETVKNLIAKIDHLSLQQKKPVTKRLVGEALAELEKARRDD